MPADQRPPAFQFYPREWIIDTRHMTRDQRCRYHDALCESWLAESYGIATEEQWREWMEYSPEDWASVRSVFAKRFKSLSGKWVQSMMVDTRAAQRRRRDRASKGASVTNASRWGNVAERRISDRIAVAPASASASALEPSQGSFPSNGTKESRLPPPGVSAACLAKMKLRFPRVDLAVVEAKLLAYHAAHPYRSLDMAFVNWCKKAETGGIDLLAPTEDEEWRP